MIKINKFEKYFIENFEIEDFITSVKIFNESTNWHKLSFTFKKDEILIVSNITQNSKGKICLYGLYCNFLGSDAMKILSDKMTMMFMRKKIFEILNQAIADDKKRVERIYMNTNSLSLLDPKPLSEWCPHCESMMEIESELRIQQCPQCGKNIKPCSLCYTEETNCKKCLIEVKNYDNHQN